MAEQTQHDEGKDQVYHQKRNSNPNVTRKRYEKRMKSRLRVGVLFQDIISCKIGTKHFL